MHFYLLLTHLFLDSQTVDDAEHRDTLQSVMSTQNCFVWTRWEVLEKAYE